MPFTNTKKMIVLFIGFLIIQNLAGASAHAALLCSNKEEQKWEKRFIRVFISGNYIVLQRAPGEKSKGYIAQIRSVNTGSHLDYLISRSPGGPIVDLFTADTNAGRAKSTDGQIRIDGMMNPIEIRCVPDAPGTPSEQSMRAFFGAIN